VNEENLEKRASAQKTGETVTKTAELDATGAPKICKRPGCTTELSPTNKSGKCAKHFHWSETPKVRSSAGNGHAAAGLNGANGHAKPAGSETVIRDLPLDLVESRLARLFASMTIAEKTKIAQAFLSGEI
jgi:hypothetical protein